MATSREQRRKAQRKYESKVRRARAKNTKGKIMVHGMEEKWRVVVAKYVPFFLQVISYYVPPRWYIKFFEQIIVRLIFMKHRYLARFIRYVFLLPPYKVKAFLRTFGTRIRVVPQGNKYVMRIYHWFKLVDESEWAL